MDMHSWTPVTDDNSVLALKYSFGFGTANSVAARLDDGSWLVVSPAVNLPDVCFNTLLKQGPVSALVAPNAFHHLGQSEWRAKFSNAVSYAPENALNRLAKKASSIAFEPLANLRPKFGGRFELVVPLGMKAADCLVRIGTPTGNVWFVGDLISNTVPDDVSFLPRLLFGLLGGGPGYRFNPVPAMMYLKDKPTWQADVRARFQAAPPTVIVPAHGLPITADAAGLTQKILT